MNKAVLIWVGGKKSSITMIKKNIGYGVKRLVEPFVGGGTVFMNIDAKEYLLCDMNQDLIDFHNSLKFGGKKFINDCGVYFNSKYNEKEIYYKIRNEFNSLTDIYKRSIRFLYLNKLAFNGICKYSSDGKFGGTYGGSVGYSGTISYRKRKYKFPRNEMLFFHHKSKKATFICQDFEKTIESCNESDVIYCDPPYIPINNLIDYNLYVDTLTFEQQKKLALLAKQSKSLFLISNNDMEYTRKIYQEADYIDSILINRQIRIRKRKNIGQKIVKELLAVYMGVK